MLTSEIRAECDTIAKRRAEARKATGTSTFAANLSGPVTTYTGEPCFKCGTRADVGCKHRRVA